MHIRLQLTGDDGYDELNSLRRWLANELEFRRVIGIDEAPVQPCRVGGLAEVFTISATGSGTQTAQATTDSVWRCGNDDPRSP